AGREQQRSKGGPRRTGQKDHMFGIRDGSTANGYQKRSRKPRTDYMNDPAVIARREKALLRRPAAE
ncbi:ISNCY family transposase, partial [Rhizobium wenxiniae]|nr:ISNCY family transposase [Rhizobium wenxiniae]